MAPTDTTNLVGRMAEANELAKDPEAVKEVYKYGRTPVMYLPTRAMARKPATPGLMEFIRQATTVKEVENLVKRGELEYQWANIGTVRKWRKVADKRIAQLNPVKANPRSGHTPLESVVKKPKVVKKSKKA
jgi:hypothetical protein